MTLKITGTMIPVLVLGEYYGRTVQDLYDEVLFGAVPTPDNGDMQRGRELERVVIDAACEREGYTVLSLQEEPKYEYDHFVATGHVDALVRASNGDLVVLEVKCPRSHKSRKIGEDGCPREYILQAAWYAMLCDSARSEVIVWDCDNWDYRKFLVPRSTKLEAVMLARAVIFASNVALGERPVVPEPDTGEIPIIGQSTVYADEHVEELCQELHIIAEECAVLEAREKEIRAELEKSWPADVKMIRSVWGSLSLQDGRVTSKLDERKLISANPTINLDDYRTQKKGKPFVSFRSKKVDSATE